MKIIIVGSGYVGLCTAVGFANLGHDVVCVDIDEEKVSKINNGEAPIYEDGLEKMLSQALQENKLHATTDIESIKETDFVFIAVGTPSKDSGAIDLKYIESASADIANFIKDKNYCTVVVKSTVLPETTEKIVIPILEKSGKKAGRDFGVCVNPEFLREGKALEDFFSPDRIVIGELDRKSGDLLEKLYSNFKAPMMRTNLKTAELIKYASNAFLATKITFINEIGNMCKNLGIDVYDVAEGMGMDKRISTHFLQAGIGFGGSCFRKDVEALLAKSKELHSESKILNTVLDINKDQPLKIVNLLKKKLPNLDGKTIAVLGLAFKEGTDDIRDAPSIIIISELLKHNCKINSYDPKASTNMRKLYPDINYCSSVSDALSCSDACLILTGWDEFKRLSDKDFNVMNSKIIIEGRRVLDKSKVSGAEGVCW
ncbi:MAG: UDP-glucose/GDP-mannose dehydrogenase family protein [Candidatus Aenigmatarchaeota archaeon]